MLANPFIGFENFDSLANDYELSDEERKKYSKANFIVATYEYGNYEGYSFVLFELDGILFEVNGSHCSCYGLEGQFKPEEVVPEELLGRLERNYFYFESDKTSATVISALKSFISTNSETIN